MAERARAPAAGQRLIGEFAFATFLIGFVVWYFLDAWETSRAVENLILILPVAALCVLLYAVILLDLLRRARTREHPTPQGTEDGTEETDEAAKEQARDRRAFALMGLTCLYVAAMIYLPFDVVTVAYLAVTMILGGERRWPVVALYSVGFGLFVVLGFQAMLSVPFPTLLPIEP